MARPQVATSARHNLDLKIATRNIDDLKPLDRRARTHSKKQIHQIARSIERFGFTLPILIDGDDRIIAGHGRVEAARLVGMREVPAIRLDHMTEADIRTYALADNEIAAKAGWDREILKIELQHLSTLQVDLSLTGFETGELDILLGDSSPDDELAALPSIDRSKPAVTRPGDLWLLGPHRLLCGDATDVQVLDRLMAGSRAEIVFVDPPYNVPIDGHARGLARKSHDEFAMASGEMSEAQFTAFLERAFRGLACQSADGAIIYVCMDWRHLSETLTAGRSIFRALKNLCVWQKSNAGMGSLYRSQHELILVFKNGAAPHINNIELGRRGRHRTNVWSYPGLAAFQDGRDEALSLHPTVKPVALVADALRDCSHRNGIVLDSFAGSGTTLIAAEITGRRAYALEIDPYYVDAAVERFESRFGLKAHDAQSGLSFDARREACERREDSQLAPEVANG